MTFGERSAVTPDKGLQYQPALDGVRAVAVVMVLFFDAGFGWMGGGNLGVSVFFTLSGSLFSNSTTGLPAPGTATTATGDPMVCTSQKRPRTNWPTTT